MQARVSGKFSINTQDFSIDYGIRRRTCDQRCDTLSGFAEYIALPDQCRGIEFGFDPLGCNVTPVRQYDQVRLAPVNINESVFIDTAEIAAFDQFALFTLNSSERFTRETNFTVPC